MSSDLEVCILLFYERLFGVVHLADSCVYKVV